jgi:hypothetical protein
MAAAAAAAVVVVVVVVVYVCVSETSLEVKPHLGYASR